MKRHWFKRKQYGWGWQPATWEGWAVTGVYILAIAFVASTLDETASEMETFKKFITWFGAVTVLFLVIAWRTGERPRWQWGKSTEPTNDNERETL